jgi:hypothetical protein
MFIRRFLKAPGDALGTVYCGHLRGEMVLAMLAFAYKLEDATLESMVYDPEFLILRPLSCLYKTGYESAQTTRVNSALMVQGISAGSEENNRPSIPPTQRSSGSLSTANQTRCLESSSRFRMNRFVVFI